MKVIIAGSRGIEDLELVRGLMSRFKRPVSLVVSGAARGVDTLGELWAKENAIPVKRFPAQWDLYGKAAGFRRNIEMAAYADVLAAISLNRSRGTEHMIMAMEELGKPSIVWRLSQVTPDSAPYVITETVFTGKVHRKPETLILRREGKW